MPSTQLNQSQLLDKAIKTVPVYCLTKYITSCAWDADIAINERMVRITTFFAYIECLQNHGVQLFSDPFEKWQFGPVVIGQYAYTKVWGTDRWLSKLKNDNGLVVFSEDYKSGAFREYQILDYSRAEWYFDNQYPYLRSILTRIFSALDTMSDIELSQLLLKISSRLFEKQGEAYCMRKYLQEEAVLVSMQELKTFPLFEEFLTEITA